MWTLTSKSLQPIKWEKHECEWCQRKAETYYYSHQDTMDQKNCDRTVIHSDLIPKWGMLPSPELWSWPSTYLPFQTRGRHIWIDEVQSGIHFFFRDEFHFATRSWSWLLGLLLAGSSGGLPFFSPFKYCQPGRGRGQSQAGWGRSCLICSMDTHCSSISASSLQTNKAEITVWRWCNSRPHRNLFGKDKPHDQTFLRWLGRTLVATGFQCLSPN